MNGSVLSRALAGPQRTLRPVCWTRSVPDIVFTLLLVAAILLVADLLLAGGTMTMAGMSAMAGGRV